MKSKISAHNELKNFIRKGRCDFPFCLRFNLVFFVCFFFAVIVS
jgi:hypothetical protein